MPGEAGRRRLQVALVAALFATCAALWSLSIPPFETPDETGHARYVNILMYKWSLPVPGEEAAGEAHQPPLYYALAALTARVSGLDPIPVAPELNRTFRWFGGSSEAKYRHAGSEIPPLTGGARSLHRLRLLSVAMGVGTVLLVYLLGVNASASPGIAIVAAALAGFTPQFTFISASLNNDNLANLASAASLACLSAAVRRPSRIGAWTAAGVFAGLGLLAKFTGLMLLPCGIVALVLAWRGLGSSTSERLNSVDRPAVAFFLPALAIPAALFWRNYLTLGDPFGVGSTIENLPALVERKSLTSIYFLQKFPSALFRSYWGTFGWMSFSMPDLIYAGFLALSLVALLGLFLLRPDDAIRRQQLLLGFAITGQFAQIVAYNLTFTQPQGRFLFPVIGPIAVLICSGLTEVGRRLRIPPPGATGIYLLITAMAIANFGILRYIVIPGYYDLHGWP
jgi:4-amino-4-deoxy-L-arabinose transferase-like glycosyltransferase